MSQRILVLGASGYIGQHLVKRLSEQGFTVLAAARHIDRLKKQQLPGVAVLFARFKPAGRATRPAGAG